jgi:hypothetical protein
MKHIIVQRSKKFHYPWILLLFCMPIYSSINNVEFSSEQQLPQQLLDELLQRQDFLSQHNIVSETCGQFNERFNAKPVIDALTPPDFVARVMYWSKKLQVPVDEIGITERNCLSCARILDASFLIKRSQIRVNVKRYEKASREKRVLTIIHELAHITLEHILQLSEKRKLSPKQIKQLHRIEEREADLYFAIQSKEVFEIMYPFIVYCWRNNARRPSAIHPQCDELMMWLEKIKTIREK